MIENVRPSAVETVKTPYIRTVRVIIQDCDGRVLLLRKSDKSKAPNLWEFPGGKIDQRDRAATQSESAMNAGIREVFEETGIDLSATALAVRDEFNYSFHVANDNITHYRKVYLLHVQLERPVEVTVGQMTDKEGESVDKHVGYRWVTKRELSGIRRERLLSGNSCNYDPVLGFEY